MTIGVFPSFAWPHPGAGQAGALRAYEAAAAFEGEEFGNVLLLTEAPVGPYAFATYSAVPLVGLFEALRTKVALLQQTVELINEMRKGNQAEAGRLLSQ